MMVHLYPLTKHPYPLTKHPYPLAKHPYPLTKHPYLLALAEEVKWAVLHMRVPVPWLWNVWNAA